MDKTAIPDFNLLVGGFPCQDYSVASSLATSKGLEGKKYSTWNGPIELAIMENTMEASGADYSKLQLIPNVVTNEAFALENGETDAIWIYYAWAGIACEMSGLQFDYYTFTDINEVFDYYTPVIVANNEFLKESPLSKAGIFIKIAIIIVIIITLVLSANSLMQQRANHGFHRSISATVQTGEL